LIVGHLFELCFEENDGIPAFASIVTFLTGSTPSHEKCLVVGHLFELCFEENDGIPAFASIVTFLTGSTPFLWSVAIKNGPAA
jgi:hypothetical protein